MPQSVAPAQKGQTGETVDPLIETNISSLGERTSSPREATYLPRRTMTGEEMTGIVLRARRRRLPGHRNAEQPRSQPEFADDLGYHRNTLAQLERGANALGKRGRILHLALCTLEREAGLVEWQELTPEQRAEFVNQAKRDLREAAREHGTGAQRPRAAAKGRAAKKARK